MDRAVADPPWRRPVNGRENLLEVLGVADREDTITNLLQYCFLHSDSFRSAFLARVCDIRFAAEGWTARTRLQVPGHGTPDLVLGHPGSPETLVVVENKLGAREGKDQTERYGSPECLRWISQKMNIGPDPNIHLRFLTLYPDEPRHPEFEAVQYDPLIDFPANSITDDRLAAWLWSSLRELLTEFYSHRSLDAEDILLERLRPAGAGGLDGGYLGFLAFLNRLHLNGLQVHVRFRESKQGRVYYGAVLNKASWLSAPIEKMDETWTLPEEHYHVHLEPQFNPLNGRFDLFVHYETNPYHPVGILKEHVSGEEYDHYRQRRIIFADCFADRLQGDFKIGGRSNQIAKARLNLKGRTVAESEALVGDAINRATAALDETMAAVFGASAQQDSRNRKVSA